MFLTQTSSELIRFFSLFYAKQWQTFLQFFRGLKSPIISGLGGGAKSSHLAFGKIVICGYKGIFHVFHYVKKKISNRIQKVI